MSRNISFIFLFGLFVILNVGCSERQEVKAKVIGLTYNPIIGKGWTAKAWYEYIANEQKFIDTVYFYDNEITLTEGQEFTVIYSVNNPEKNKIKN